MVGWVGGGGRFADLHKATTAVAPLDIFHIYTLCGAHSATEHLTRLYVTRRSHIISTLAADKVALVSAAAVDFLLPLHFCPRRFPDRHCLSASF